MSAVLNSVAISTEDFAADLNRDGVSLIDVAEHMLGYSVVQGGDEVYLKSITGDYIAVTTDGRGIQRAVSMEHTLHNLDVIALMMSVNPTLKTPACADQLIRKEMSKVRCQSLEDDLRTQDDGRLHMALAFAHVLQKQGATLTVVATTLFGYQDKTDREGGERYIYHPITGDSAYITKEPNLGVDVACFPFAMTSASQLHVLNFARSQDSSLPSKPSLMAEELRTRLRAAGVALRV